MAQLSSIEQDDNSDGKVDRLEFSLLFPMPSNEIITGFSAVVYHEVRIYQEARYLFDAMSYVSYESMSPISTLFIDGDIKIRQQWPFNGKGGYVRYILYPGMPFTFCCHSYKSPYSDDPLLTITNEMSTNDISIKNLMCRNNARNCKSCNIFWSIFVNSNFYIVVRILLLRYT